MLKATGTRVDKAYKVCHNSSMSQDLLILLEGQRLIGKVDSYTGPQDINSRLTLIQSRMQQLNYI